MRDNENDLPDLGIQKTPDFHIEVVAEAHINIYAQIALPMIVSSHIYYIDS